MNIVNLPTETANIPLEDARLFQMQHQVGQELTSKKPNVSFTNHNEPLNRPQNSRSYMDILSQPPQELSHKLKLIWLQKRRSTGLWVQCDDCDRWRYLDDILDSYELPKKWYCRMNPDSKLASCSIPEAPLQVREEEDLIYSKYAAGSVVWARMPGWPWWPAMVDDCPDTEQYYWLDGFSDIPTDFHVVFFDIDVTRAWISHDQLRHYATNKDMTTRLLLKDKKYLKRLEIAVAQANDAVALPLSVRLSKYSFIARYKGKISTPKKIYPESLQKYRNQMKRKFNIDIPIDSSSDSDDASVMRNIKKKSKQTIVPRKNSKGEAKKAHKRFNEEIGASDKPNKQENSVDTESLKDCNSMAVEVSDNNSLSTMCLSSGIATYNEKNAKLSCDTTTQGSEKETHTGLQERNSPSFEFD